MVKILLDTDIGGDVDDAVALAYLLSHPDCDLLGITTVAGGPALRASLATVLCIAAGKDIPIYPGADRAIGAAQPLNDPEQATVLPRWPHETEFPQGQAVEFLRRTIQAHPGEVILLTIGPLTNAGMLFSQYPEVAPLLKGLVIMGGIYSPDYPDKNRDEWNLKCDPQATEIVYRTPVKLHRSIGLDVTEKVVMPAEEVRRRFTAPLLRPVLDMGEVWFTQFYPFITFHDPLTAATIFQPDLCTYEQGIVTIQREHFMGWMRFTPGGADAPHQVAFGVDPERYFEHYFQVVNSYR
jgi:inosine-uridine nucleoside N-ribohydrolase